MFKLIAAKLAVVLLIAVKLAVVLMMVFIVVRAALCGAEDLYNAYRRWQHERLYKRCDALLKRYNEVQASRRTDPDPESESKVCSQFEAMYRRQSQSLCAG